MWNQLTAIRLSDALANEYELFWEAVERNDKKLAMSYSKRLRRLENAYDRLVFGRQR